MSGIIYVPRAFGGTIAYSPPGAQPVTALPIIAILMFRDGMAHLTFRDGVAQVDYRSGNATATFRSGNTTGESR